MPLPSPCIYPLRPVVRTGGLALLLLGSPLAGGRSQEPASTVPQAFLGAAEALGKPGAMKAEEGVYVTSFPRRDLVMDVEGVRVPTALGFSSWVALREAPDGGVVAMSDLVLLEDEVNPVVSVLQEHGIEITALHRHFAGEKPRVMYLHSHARGQAEPIARGYRAALDATATPLGDAAPAGPEPVDVDTAAIARIVGRSGELSGRSVYKITVGRGGLQVRALGTEVTTSMGLNSWAAFVGTDERAHIAGDIAMLAEEVNPVVRALRERGIEIVSIHNHMLDEEPRTFFLHYWGTGPAAELAHAFRAALDALGRP